MTRDELFNIARRMDEETRDMIDREVEEKLEILKEGDLTEEELEQMEEYLYASLVLQEYLNGEYELLEEERQELFDEMEEMYNKYADLLVRARIEEKVSKKKRMTLELMKIREQLMDRKDDYKDIKQKMKDNRDKHNELKDMTKKENLKQIAKKEKGQGIGLDGLPGKSNKQNKMDELKKDLERAMNQIDANTINGVQRVLDNAYNNRHTGVGVLDANSNEKPQNQSTKLNAEISSAISAKRYNNLKK